MSLVHCLWEFKMVQAPWKTLLAVSLKTNIQLLYDPAMALLGIFREKKTRSHKILSTNVCSSSRCNSQELETTQMNLSRQIIKETVVPLYDGILWAAFLLKPKAFSALNQQRALAIDKREKSFLETVSGIHLECWGNTKTVILLTKSIARPAEVTCSLFIQQICDQYCKPSSVLDTRS